MKNLLLLIALGFTTVLFADPISNVNINEDVRQKKDDASQRKQYREERSQTNRQSGQRERQKVETQRTIRTQEEPKRTQQRQEERKQIDRRVNQMDTQKVEVQRTIRMQEEPKRTQQRQEERKQIDRRVNQRDSIQRTFRTYDEFKRERSRIRANYSDRYDRMDYKRRYNIRQSGVRYFNNDWFFIYQTRHAPFYDSYGNFYGFFNRFGYFFEGVFYTYDRYYTYEDRLRGKELFDNRYYAPYLENGYDDWYDIYDDPYYEER